MFGIARTARHSLRTLTRQPGFAVIAVVTAALGIGASTTIFSAFNAVLLRPLPYPDASRLVYVGTAFDGVMPYVTSIPDFMDWRERIVSLDGLGALQPTALIVESDDASRRVPAARISPDVFDLLGATPIIGREFTDDEHRTNGPRAVILGRGYWLRRWGGAVDVIGKEMITAPDEQGQRASYTIVGVLPAGFEAPAAAGLRGAELWLPLEGDAQAYSENRTSRSLRLIGRLKPSVSLDSLRQELATLATTMAAEYPGAYGSNDGVLSIGATALLNQTVGETGYALQVLLGSTGILLLLGCANVANLLLARGGARVREIALRSALGASRRGVIGQLLTESVFIGLLGGLVGAAIAVAGVQMLLLVAPADFPRLADVTVDWRVLGFALAMATVTGLVFGAVPAVLNSRVDLAATLKEAGGTTSAGRRRKRARGVLVVAETALALVLLSAAGLLIASYGRLQNVDPGFRPDHLVMSEVGLNPSYTTDEKRAGYFDQLVRAVTEIPGVRSASTVPDPPVAGYAMWTPGMYGEGSQAGKAFQVAAHLIGPDYFETMGMRIRSGREVTPDDRLGRVPVIVVSATAARNMWSDEDPVGRQVRLSSGADAQRWTVIGVVDDVRQYDLSVAPQGEIYVPYAQNAWFRWNYVVLRTDSDAATIAPQLQRIMRDLDPDVPFDGVTTMDQRISRSLSSQRFNAVLLVVFAATALLLAAAGIYATMLYAVGERIHEMGIRMAIGARAADVLLLIVRQGVVLTAVGIIVGVAGSLVLSRAMSGLIFGVESTDPSTLAIASGGLMVVALCACLIPARRATRINLVRTLRED